MTDVNVLAIIPARGGSKGIPQKNLAPLAGKPLLVWTIEACLKSSFVTKTIVTSDNRDILSIAKAAGAEPFLRPCHLAKDETLTVPVVSNVIDELGDELRDYRFLVLMQPTSPLRTARHLDEAFSLLIHSNATSLISVVEPEYNPLKAFVLEDGCLKGAVNNEYPFMRRQELPPTYLANGAIYIVDLPVFKRERSLLTECCIPYKMDLNASLDIDAPADLERARQVMSGCFLDKAVRS